MPTGLGDEQLWLCPTLNDSANDISGNGNDGTYQGGMATVADTGAGGSRAYNHDTTGREILLPADLGISGTSMSISMWFNNTSNAVGSSADNWFGAYDGTYANSNMRIYQFQSLILADDRNESPDTFINPYATLSTTSSWVHVVAVADGSAGEYRFYVDGVLADTVSSGGSDMTVKTTVPWRVGGGGISPSAIGMSDDIRTYDRALTQAEIVHLAASRGVEGGPDNCGLKTDITYWSDLSDGTSASLPDSSGGPDVLTRNGGLTDLTGSPRSSACVNYSNVATNYHTLNGGVDVAAPPSEYSVSVWSYFGSASPTFGNWVANQRDASTGDHWQIFRWNTGNIAVHELGSITRSVEVLSNLGQWYHISFSRTDAALSVYVNGSLVGTDTSSITQSTGASPIALGTAAWDQGSSSTHNNGSQWAFGMWDRELSASEHWQLYQAGSGLLYSEFCPTPPAGGFYNPFINKTFNQNYTNRIG